MSYEIIYDKQFIRMPKGFIAMTLAGSNNCYQAGSGNKMKRSRDWCNWNSLDKLVCTEEELLDYVNGYRERLIKQYVLNEERPDTEDVYEDKRFGWFTSLSIKGGRCSSTTFGNFKGVFTVGMQKALTVEELKEHGISTRIFTSTYSEKENRLKGFEPIQFCPQTSQELQDFIDENESKPIRFYIDFYGASESTFKWMRLRRRRSVETPKEKTLVTEAYAIVLHTGAYFWKLTKYGYKYSYSSPKYYYTKTAVNSALKKVQERIGGNASIETIKFDSPRSI